MYEYEIIISKILTKVFKLYGPIALGQQNSEIIIFYSIYAAIWPTIPYSQSLYAIICSESNSVRFAAEFSSHVF